MQAYIDAYYNIIITSLSYVQCISNRDTYPELNFCVTRTLAEIK